MRIELDSEPYAIIEFQFVKPGKKCIYEDSNSHLINGSVLDRTFKTSEKLKPADTRDRTMQFLYRDEGMEVSFYGQQQLRVSSDADLVGDATNYLIDNME